MEITYVGGYDIIFSRKGIRIHSSKKANYTKDKLL